MRFRFCRLTLAWSSMTADIRTAWGWMAHTCWAVHLKGYIQWRMATEKNGLFSNQTRIALELENQRIVQQHVCNMCSRCPLQETVQRKTHGRFHSHESQLGERQQESIHANMWNVPQQTLWEFLRVAELHSNSPESSQPNLQSINVSEYVSTCISYLVY